MIAELSKGLSESPDKQSYSDDMNNDLLDGNTPANVRSQSVEEEADVSSNE